LIIRLRRAVWSARHPVTVENQGFKSPRGRFQQYHGAVRNLAKRRSSNQQGRAADR